MNNSPVDVPNDITGNVGWNETKVSGAKSVALYRTSPFLEDKMYGDDVLDEIANNGKA